MFRSYFEMNEHGANPTKLFYLLTNNFFRFGIKLGHFMANKTVYICYKHSNLIATIGKRVETKFDRIDS